jgi:hypothetical protein
MTMMTKILTAVAFAACVAFAGLPAQAQQPSAAAITNAKKIMELKKADAMYKPVLVGVIEQAKSVLIQSNLNLSKDLNEVSLILAKEYANRANIVEAELARRYAGAFTEQELKDLVVFYSSPLGQKTITTEPVVLQESMVYMEEWATKLSEEVMGAFRKEMKKRGHDI